MLPYINIFGRQLPTYGVCVFIAALAGWIMARLRRKKWTDLSRDDCDYGYVFAIIGVFIGAKLLSIITVLPLIIRDFNMLFTDTEEFLSRYVYSGFVFYGGLFGGIIAEWLYCRSQNVPFASMVQALLPSIPLAHGIGRIGCFCAGCCYGLPSEKFGIVLKNSAIAPNDVPLLPVQLIECAGNFIIAAVLLLYMRKRPHPYRALALYMVMYPILRFVLEFFRYDAYRGIFLSLSTSQWICIIAWVFAAILLCLARRSEKLKSE